MKRNLVFLICENKLNTLNQNLLHFFCYEPDYIFDSAKAILWSNFNTLSLCIFLLHTFSTNICVFMKILSAFEIWFVNFETIWHHSFATTLQCRSPENNFKSIPLTFMSLIFLNVFPPNRVIQFGRAANVQSAKKAEKGCCTLLKFKGSGNQLNPFVCTSLFLLQNEKRGRSRRSPKSTTHLPRRVHTSLVSRK